MKYKTIITDYPDFCIICGRPAEGHHCPYGTANHILAEQDHLVFPLCHEHHRNGKMAAHKCKEVDVLLHIIAQEVWEKKYIVEKRGLPFDDIEEEARNAWRKRYGESWI